MDDGGHTLFDTPIGVCGIAWGPGGVVAVQLPEADAARTRARLLKGLHRMEHPRRASRDPLEGAALAVRRSRPGGAPGRTVSFDAGGAPAPWRTEVAQPPATVQAAIEGIQALLMGEARDLREVPLDMTRLTPFQREVYAMARAIPPGQTRTYGEMAQALGDAGLARAVGQALGHNPFAPVVPCHRVLAAGSRSGGFSARGGVATKLRMLQIEGAQIGGEPGLFDGDGA